MERFHHVEAIDGLRSIAVALVFAMHTYPDILPGGFIGVDIFFVISGYLITSLFVREIEATATVSLASFYWRRTLRILPASLFCAAAVFLAAPQLLQTNGESAPLNAVAAMFGFMNWLRAWTNISGAALGHFWSLAIEEQFYGLWSVIVLAFIVARKVEYLPRAAGGLLLLSLGWTACLGLSHSDPDRIYNGLDSHACGLLLGCILAGLPKARLVGHVSRFWPLISSTAVLEAVLFDVNSQWLWLYIPACSITGLSMILCALDERSIFARILSSRIATWLGRRSYSFYLWHMPIVMACFQSGIPRSLWILPSFLACLLASEASYRFIEQPFLRLKDRSRITAAT